MKFVYEYPEINMNNIRNQRVISLVGPSGSGKTTVCNEILRNFPNSLHIDLDKMFFQECKEDPALFAKSLRSIIKTIKQNQNNGQIMIFDGNYKALERKYGIDAILFIILTFILFVELRTLFAVNLRIGGIIVKMKLGDLLIFQC